MASYLEMGCQMCCPRRHSEGASQSQIIINSIDKHITSHLVAYLPWDSGVVLNKFICLELGQKPKRKMERVRARTRRLMFLDPNVRRSQTGPTSLFFSSIFCQLLLTIYRYRTVYLSAWQPGQHRLVWKKKNKHAGCMSFWEGFRHVDIFRVTRLCFTKKPFQWTGPDLLNKQRFTPCLIYFRFASWKKNEADSHDLVTLSCTTQNSSTFLLFFFFFQSFFPLSCPRFALSCLKSRLSNYQRLACGAVTLDWVISTDCFPWESAE